VTGLRPERVQLDSYVVRVISTLTGEPLSEREVAFRDSPRCDRREAELALAQFRRDEVERRRMGAAS